MKILNDIIPKNQNSDDKSTNILSVQDESAVSSQESDSAVVSPATSNFTAESIQKIEKIESTLSDNPFLLRYAKHTVTENDSESEVKSQSLPEGDGSKAGLQNNTVTTNKVYNARPSEYGYVGKMKHSGGGKRFARWVVATLSVVALVSAYIYTTSKTEIVIHPKVKSISVENQELVIPIESQEDYYTLENEVEEVEKVLSDGSTTESQAATGRVVLYNTYSTSKQNLLIDTRLETVDGLIFKTKTAVSIPGYTTSGGKIVPGQVEVDVYAESTGDKYNIDLTDFKVFGFKSNKDKYEKFYARSLTPMTGGSEGLVYTLSDVKRDEAISLMTTRAMERVESKLLNEIPEGYVALESTKVIGEPSIYSSSKSTDIDIEQKVSVSASVDIVKEDIFISSISTDEDDNSSYKIEDISTMVLVPEKIDGSEIRISANGVAKLVGKIDLEEVHKSLLGKSISEFETLLTSYPQIEKIDAKLKPFWRKTLPDDPLKLEVVLAE